MRETIKDRNRLEHILEACNLLMGRKDKDSLETLSNDPIKFYGYVKLVEIIGEATFKLTHEYRDAHKDIPWNMMEGMRHVLVHEYYHISPQKLWDTINDESTLKSRQSTYGYYYVSLTLYRSLTFCNLEIFLYLCR